MDAEMRSAVIRVVSGVPGVARCRAHVRDASLLEGEAVGRALLVELWGAEGRRVDVRAMQAASIALRELVGDAWAITVVSGGGDTRGSGEGYSDA